MELNPLGDFAVSQLTLGPWAFSGGGWGEVDDMESIATVHSAIDLGINMADTAEGYGGGRSEEVLGKALSGRRHDMYIATKVSRVTPDDITAAVEGSLKRLGTDYIDLYQVHWPRKDVPIADTMSALSKLKKEGKTRAIGVSNYSVPQMAESLETARIDSLQPPYSLLWRMIEKNELPFCVKNRIAVLPYSPMAQGLLTGKFSKNSPLGDGDLRLGNRLFQGKTWLAACDAVEELQVVAADYGKSLAQLSLNWLSAQTGVTSPIVGAKRPSQIEESCGSVGWTIRESDLERIEALCSGVAETLNDCPNPWQEDGR